MERDRQELASDFELGHGKRRETYEGNEMVLREINTVDGWIEESLLEKKTGEDTNDNETARWIEYWMDGKLMQRSVHVHLGKNVAEEGIAAMLS